MASTDSNRPVVLITGASAGIGAAAVGVFARAGYDVVLTARRKDRLEKIAVAVSSENTQAQIVPLICDVNSDESVSAAFAQVKQHFGRLDVLVNNAGFGVYGSVERTPLQTYRDNMETNFFGVIRCTQAALPLLRTAANASRKRWGASIVMVSSIVGRRTIPGMSAYCASKFALEALSETLRVELHDERIAVSVVNPGVTQTDFVESAKGERPGNYLPPKGGMTSEAVAEVLLKAARRPRRNRYLTGSGKAGILAQWAAPSVLDSILLRTWRKASGAQPGGVKLKGDEMR
jgi:short-subunit dehydrogenase